MAEARARSHLAVLTWNVWFDRLEYRSRIAAIFDITRQLKPDVVCFQEVLPEFIKILQSQSWAKEYATHSDQDGSTVRPYGTLTLCRSAKTKVNFHHFPSQMNRKLLAVEIKEEGQLPWMVGNVHLESLNSTALRKLQLQESMKVLGAHRGNALLVGDFNFCSYRSWAEGRRLGREGRADSSPLENDALPQVLPGFIDVWETLRPGERGYTFDSERNGVIRQYEQMRYDRIMARLADGWEPTSIEMVGTDKIKTSQDTPFGVCPSDHFGLFCTFQGPAYHPSPYPPPPRPHPHPDSALP